MRLSCNHFSDEQLRNLLQADDGQVNAGDREITSDSANHLAECPHCQSRLEQLAAEPTDWIDIRDCLLPVRELDGGRRSSSDKVEPHNPRWVREPWQRPNA